MVAAPADDDNAQCLLQLTNRTRKKSMNSHDVPAVAHQAVAFILHLCAMNVVFLMGAGTESGACIVTIAALHFQ